MTQHRSKLFILLLTSLILVGVFAVGSAAANPAAPQHVQPALLDLAKSSPDSSVRVIVQAADLDQVKTDIAALGGTITQDMHIIQAVAADMPAGAVPALADMTGVRWVSLDGPVASTAVATKVRTKTIADYFNSRSYDNNDGSQQWLGPWAEIRDDNKVAKGQVRIVNGNLRLRSNNRGIQRTADLTQADTAVLTFNYRRVNMKRLDNFVKLGISVDNGLSWITLDELAGPANDRKWQQASYDLSPYVGQEIKLAFLTSAKMRGYFLLDDLQIEYTPTKSHKSGAAPVVHTVADEFNSNGYQGNDGTSSWAGPWIETEPNNDIQSPISGLVQVINGELRLNNVENDEVHPGAARTVDLSQAITASFSFDYRTSFGVDASDGIAVEVSPDGGKTYILLETIENLSGASSGSRSYDITRFATNQTTVRLRVAYFYGSADELFYVDNVKVSYTLDGNLPMYGRGQTIADDFNSYPYDYSSNSGSMDWLNAWQEVNDDGHFDSGDVRTNGYDGGYALTFWTDTDPAWEPVQGIWRAADLSGANWAELSFLYSRGSMDVQDYMAVEVSLDDGATWTEIGRIEGKGTMAVAGTDDGWLLAAYNISEYISANTAVRLITHFEQNDYYDNIYIDNIEIVFNKPPENLQPNTYLDTLKVQSVWDMGIDGSGVTVAVVDSGVALDYDFSTNPGEPLADRVLVQMGFNANSNIVRDNYGHGTHVAGIIGGNGTGSGGFYQGMAPGVNLIGLKVSDDNGMAYESDTVAALQWVLENKDVYNIRVVNLSINSVEEQSYHNSPLDAAVEILWFNDIVVVASAGNETGPHNTANAAPANDPFIITVGASEENYTANRKDDWMAKFSAHGITQDGYLKPDIVAPGKDIISVLAASSSWRNEAPERFVEGGYFRISGTSMAAPMVSGAVALLLQAEPNLTPDQVKYRLANTGSSLKQQSVEYPYLNVYDLVTTQTEASANTGVAASQLLWSGDQPVVWDSVAWNSVAWNSVAWNSVAWNSVAWNSVAWNSVSWDD